MIPGHGFCRRYLRTGLLLNFFVFSVVARQLNNDTSIRSTTNRIRKVNDSSYPTQTRISSKLACLCQICEHASASWLWIFSSTRNLIFGTNNQGNKFILDRIHSSCRKGKGLPSGILNIDYDIFVALYGVDIAVSWCPTSCSSKKTRSHDSTKGSYHNCTAKYDLTDEECRGTLMIASHTRQCKLIFRVQFFTQKGLCVIIITKCKKMEKSKCCYNIADLCIVPTSHNKETILVKCSYSQSNLKAQLEYDLSKDVEDYINQSIISLVVCVLMVIGVFLTVMTYNLWYSRKRYQDSLKSSEKVEQKSN